MTVNQFIERMNELGVTGDEEIRVSAFGGMRGGKVITTASLGFDWDAGCVILQPAAALTLYRVEDRKKERA